MAKQKRFQKITLNSDDYKWIEIAAKTTKYIGTGIAAGGTYVILKDQMSSSEEQSDNQKEPEKN